MNALVLMGLAFGAMGVFAMSMAGPLARWAANMHLFLRTDEKPAYRERKRRRIRSMAWVSLTLAAGILLYALIVALTT